jgi:hypothetical protein
MRETLIPVFPSFAYCMITPYRRLMLFCQNSGAAASRVKAAVHAPIRSKNLSGRGRLGDRGMTRAKVVAVVMNELRVDVSKQDRVDQHRREDNCHERKPSLFRSIWLHDSDPGNISTSNLNTSREAISLTAA